MSDKDIEYLKNYKYDNEVNQAIENVLSELEIKDKMIDLLIDKLFNLDYEHNFQKVICDYIPKAKCDTYEDDKCDICVKEYIRNEVLNYISELEQENSKFRNGEIVTPKLYAETEKAIFRNIISKDKIRDKIEHCESIKDVVDNGTYTFKEVEETIISVLKELLGE